MKHLVGIALLSTILMGPALAAKTPIPMSSLVTTKPYAQQEQNKETVLKFYELGLNQKNADEAAKLLGSRYVQHNPNAADGVEGFKQFIAYLKKNEPDSHSEIKRVFADGDYVILHVKATGRTTPVAIIDVFKLEEGKIVEHWDVIQPIPEKSANTNGMF